LSQSLVLIALESPSYDAEKKACAEKIAERYHKVKEILHSRPEMKEYFLAVPFNSGYFMCVRLKNRNAEEIRQTLLTQYSTGLIAFPEKNLLRVAFSSLAAGKMEKLFANLYDGCRN
jgi:hypothetical protein